MTIALYIILALAAFVAVTMLLYKLFDKAGEEGVMEDAALTKEQKIDDGYLGVPTDMSEYVGAEGIALTVLRPAGKVKIGDKILDAMSFNDFIDEGETVKVLKYENTQLYVLKK